MNNETVLILWQFISAVAIPYIIQALKKAPWFPFASFNTETLNRVFSWTVAAFTGLGLTFNFDAKVGTLTITGLTVAGVITAITHMSAQVALNHTAYKLLIAPPLSGLQQAMSRASGVLVPTGGVGTASEPEPIKSYVGNQLGSSAIYECVVGDPTASGATVEEGRGQFVKHIEPQKNGKAIEFYVKVR